MSRQAPGICQNVLGHSRVAPGGRSENIPEAYSGIRSMEKER